MCEFESKLGDLVDSVKTAKASAVTSLDQLLHHSVVTDNVIVWHSSHLAGWSAKITLWVSSVLVNTPTVVKGGKAKEHEHREAIAKHVLDRMFMAFHRVVRAPQGHLLLVASHTPITDQVADMAVNDMCL